MHRARQARGRRCTSWACSPTGKCTARSTHLFALIDAAVEAAVPLAIHAFLDGRDAPPRSAHVYIEALEGKLDAWARRARSPRSAAAFTRWIATSAGNAPRPPTTLLAARPSRVSRTDALAGLDAAYARDENDEFVLPTIVGPTRTVRDGDACIFFNFRPDRARMTSLRRQRIQRRSASWRNGDLLRP